MKQVIGPTYNNNEPMTDEEWREALKEDGRMTPEEIEEYIGSFTKKHLTLSFIICILCRI